MTTAITNYYQQWQMDKYQNILPGSELETVELENETVKQVPEKIFIEPWSTQ